MISSFAVCVMNAADEGQLQCSINDPSIKVCTGLGEIVAASIDCCIRERLHFAMKIRVRFALYCLPLLFVTSCTTNHPDTELAALQARAEKGDAEAQRTLGRMLDFGQKVKRDYVQAAKWY